MPTSSKGRLRKCIPKRNKLKRAKVLKILAAAMENATQAGPSTSADVGSAEYSDDFYNTGRIGRRNALPDILSSHATISTADLPDQLNALSTSDASSSKDKSIPGSSSNPPDVQPQPSTSASN